MKTLACVAVLCLGQLCAQGQDTFGEKTEGGGPGGSPASNCPCWRYPLRVVKGRLYDLRPQFQWWRENYGAYQSAVAAAGDSQPADFSTLAPPPLAGWHRIKEGHFLSQVAYGWLCQVVIEDYPAHAVTNKIILCNPPTADQTRWNDLVAEYYDLKAAGAPNATVKHNHNHAQAIAARQQAALQNQNQTEAQYQNLVTQAQASYTNSATNATAPKHPKLSPEDRVLAALKKFPEGTNYTIDLFAYKLGYLQDGSHRQVYDLGQMSQPH